MSDSVKPWDMLNPKEERVSDDEQAARMAICHRCEFLFKPTVQFKKCGCFMVRLINAPAVQYKGTGWAKQDRKKEGK